MKTIFGLPFYKTNIDDRWFDKLNIISQIQSNYNLNNNRNKFYDSNLHHTYGDEENNQFLNVDYQSLIKIYSQELRNFFYDFNFNKKYEFKFDIVNYTALNKSTQYMGSHVHPGCHFSSIHYLQFDKKFHKSTQFRNPFYPGSYMSYFYKDLIKLYSNETLLKNNEISNWLIDKIILDTNEGDFIIFPSFLEHSIISQPNISENVRITIVSNITIL